MPQTKVTQNLLFEWLSIWWVISNLLHVLDGYGMLINFVFSRKSSVKYALNADSFTTSMFSGLVNIQCSSSHVNSGNDVNSCVTKLFFLVSHAGENNEQKQKKNSQ